MIYELWRPHRKNIVIPFLLIFGYFCYFHVILLTKKKCLDMK